MNNAVGRPSASALLALAVAVTVVLAVAPTGARAEDDGSQATEAAGEPYTPDGTTAMVASAVYPGLGQLLNGAEPKAAIVSAAEAVLIAALLVEDRRTRNSFRMYEQTGDTSYFDDYSKHFDKRQTLIWWAAVAALYGLADAYVDAHLSGFESAPEPIVEGSPAEGERGAEFRLGLAFRF